MSLAGSIFSAFLVWIMCAMFVLIFLMSHTYGKDDRFLTERFPDSQRKRQVWGFIIIALAPVSLVVGYSYLLCVGVWKTLNGDLIRWIKRSTGM